MKKCKEIEINISTVGGLGFDSIVLSRNYKRDAEDNSKYVLLGESGYLRHFTNGLSVGLEDLKFRFEEQEISDINKIVALLGSENWKLISSYVDSRCLGDSFRLAYHVDMDEAKKCLDGEVDICCN